MDNSNIISSNNSFNKLYELVKDDTEINDLVILCNNVNVEDKIKDETKHQKYINKESIFSWRQQIFRRSLIKLLCDLCLTIKTRINNDLNYKELKHFYNNSTEGPSISGMCLYVYAVPNNVRKNKPDEISICSVGYINGGNLPYLLSDIHYFLTKKIGMNIFIDNGRMD